MAICEYLEERFPTPAILPRDPAGRARVRAITLNIACEIRPLANRRTQMYLGEHLKLGEHELGEWCRHWIALNFGAIEQMLKDSRVTGRFCHGDTPTMADIFLVPQIFNANGSSSTWRRIRRSAGSTRSASSSTRSRPRIPSVNPTRSRHNPPRSSCRVLCGRRRGTHQEIKTRQRRGKQTSGASSLPLPQPSPKTEGEGVRISARRAREFPRRRRRPDAASSVSRGADAA